MTPLQSALKGPECWTLAVVSPRSTNPSHRTGGLKSLGAVEPLHADGSWSHRMRRDRSGAIRVTFDRLAVRSFGISLLSW